MKRREKRIARQPPVLFRPLPLCEYCKKNEAEFEVSCFSQPSFMCKECADNYRIPWLFKRILV